MRRFAILFVLFHLPIAYGAERPGYVDPPLTKEDQQHWSFVTPQRAEVPIISDAAMKKRIRNPIDAFLFARLQKEKLQPSVEADKITLIRRVTFDLTGLPPTPSEIDAFLNDPSPTAYETLVDRLLASPHYGERWAQHWLDVVRFAESNGYEADGERPQAWRYRDYVVQALNADKPYDRFLTEQLAGDLMAKGKDPREVPDLYHATGMHRCGPVHKVGGNIDPATIRQEILTEMVNGVGAAVLGLTVGCARCHDHKFDPISLGDYYRLEAFFAGTEFKDVDLATKAQKEELEKKLLSVTLKLRPIKQKINAIEAPYRAKVLAEKKAALPAEQRKAVDTPANKRTEAQKSLATDAAPLLKVSWDEVLNAMNPEDRAKRDAWKEEENQIERELPPLPPQAWAVAEEPSTPVTHVLLRGSLDRKSITVNPGYVRVVSDASDAPKSRLDLAAWVTQPEHPLTARVIVNRLWQHHFGRGLVATPNDFGTRGDLPSHPELLDWLAVELVKPSISSGEAWSLKRMHRLMVCSSTYRLSSRPADNPQAVKADPSNILLSRMNRRRLEGEAIRDAVLTAAGTLTPDIGGPSVKIPLEPEIYDLIFTEGEPSGLWPVTPDVRQHTRRSLYLMMKRNVRQPLLEAFDQPDTLNSCAQRSVSTFAPQSLILMNGPFTHDQSRAMASSLEKGSAKVSEQVNLLFRRALGRLPSKQESETAVKFLNDQAALLQKQPRVEGDTLSAKTLALADLCLAVFNTNEFAYVE